MTFPPAHPVRRARPAATCAVLVALLAAACGGGSGGAAGTADAARLASVSVGSDVVLAPADVTAVNVVGLDLQTLAAPLRSWWVGLNDPERAAADWLPQADRLLADMRTTVAHIESQLGPGRDRTVRDAYAPYLTRWREILAALGALRTAVSLDDLVAQQRATAAYNDAVRAVRRLDEQRVARVVAVYGAAETRRFLTAQGIDPAAFGL